MTRVEPRLALRRLAVWANGAPVYDEKFRDGVNIIRGTNSSGKSTIADFIFFALGGDFNKWKHQASLCDHVIAEVDINGQALTLRRRVEDGLRQPMNIFWGPYDEAVKSAVAGWKVFPFQRGGSRREAAAEKESFSQVLFRSLALPEVKGDGDSNITMHQLLRVIFVDQLSPVDSLIRMEQFDSALTRNTIGDLLLGMYDDQLYADQLRLAKREKDLEALTAQYESVLHLFDEAEQETSLEVVNAQVRELEAQRSKVLAALETAERGGEVATDIADKSAELRTTAMRLKQDLAALESEAQTLTFEVNDSQQFVESLRSRLLSLDDANQVRSVLGELPLTNCPHCLAPIAPQESAAGCPLCKTEPSKETLEKHAFRLRQELSLQIKESEGLLEKKKRRLEEIKRKLPAVSEELKRSLNDYQVAVSTVKPRRDAELDQLWMMKGTLDTRIEYLHKHAKAINIFTSLKERKIAAESEISRLGLAVREGKSRQQARRALAASTIEEKTLYLLHNDLPLEEAFKAASKVTFDFATNSFAVNEENQFSASSMVYLKNSIRFAILWASIELQWMRYPRLFICDNIEDKGMHPTRSQNFQRLLVALSQEFTVAHQIIFTTSMIDPELDASDLCVGPKYGPQQKTLRM